MIIFKRLTPWLAGLLTLLALESILQIPQSFIWIFILTFLILTALVAYLVEWRIHFNRLIFAWPPLLLLAGAFLFLTIVELAVVHHLVILLSVILITIYLRNLFLYIYSPKDYQSYALDNLTVYLQVIALYFVFSGLLALPILLNSPLWLMALLVTLLTGLSAWQSLWLKELNFKTAGPGIISISLIILEFFWLSQFLPITFFVGGFLLSLIYFLSVDIIKHIYLQNLKASHLKRQLILALVLVAIVLITARWR